MDFEIKPLTKSEQETINHILKECELNISDQSETLSQVAYLDNLAKQIWDDWDDAVIASMKNFSTPKRMDNQKSLISTKLDEEDVSFNTQNSDLTKISKPSNEKEVEITKLLSNEGSSNYHRSEEDEENIPKYNNISESYKTFLNNKFKDKSIFKLNNYELSQSKKNVKRKNDKSLMSTTSSISLGMAPFTKLDAARLRQENIELREKINLTRTALNKAILERDRIKGDINKTNKQISKQRDQLELVRKGKI